MTRATKKQPIVEPLVEHAEDWQQDRIHVDRSRKMVCDIALTGRNSKNGYEYTEEALISAVDLYDGKPVFLDHAANVSRPYDRSARDLVGTITNPRYESDRIRADVQVVDTDTGRTFLALAEANHPAVGMSHTVMAERGRDRAKVVAIHDVVSVDAVVFPATTSTFRENQDSENGEHVPGSFEAAMEQIDADLFDHVRLQLPDEIASAKRRGLFADVLLIEVESQSSDAAQMYALAWEFRDQLVVLGDELEPVDEADINTFGLTGISGDEVEVSSESAAELRGELSVVAAERDGLLAEIERLENGRRRIERERLIVRLVEHLDVPQYAITESFRQQLLSVESADECRAMLEERRQLVNQLRCLPPQSAERSEQQSRGLQDAEIVSAIKRHRPHVVV